MSEAGAPNAFGGVEAIPDAPAVPAADRGIGPKPRAAVPSVRRNRLRIVVNVLVAVLFLALAWFAIRRGVIADTWPAFLPQTESTSITRYSGPWLTAAAAAVLGAGLSIMALVRGLTARPTANG